MKIDSFFYSHFELYTRTQDVFDIFFSYSDVH